MRILSLLPAATEIICALGYKNKLVGRSHECDFPADVQTLPVCTKPAKQLDNTSTQDINRNIKSLISDGLSIYQVNYEMLQSLKPDVILTQDHCEVCAVDFSEIEKAVADALDYKPVIISLSPQNLEEVMESFIQIAASVGDIIGGMNLSTRIKKKLKSITNKCTSLGPKTDVFCVEWMDPLLATGNWLPELVTAVNSDSVYGTVGKHAEPISWETVLEANPSSIILMPCGFTIDQTVADIDLMTKRDGWETLDAVKTQQVYIADGHHYFNRPGPRLLDSAKILAEILYPNVFSPKLKHKGWINMFEKPEIKL